jgi:hypothetical protein
MAWAQAYAPAPEVLAIAPAAVSVVVRPGHGWECWISRQLSHAVELATVEMAIDAPGGQDDAGNAIDPWAGEGDWEYSELSPAVFPVAVQPQRAIVMLPPAKSPQTPTPSSKGKTKKPPAKPSQKHTMQRQPKPSSSAARTPCKPTQTSRGARR